MKKIIKALFVASLMLLAVTISASADQTAYTTADVLNVRSAPSMDASVLAQYPYGTGVSVSGSQDVWYQIRFNNSYAYVHSDYVSFSPTQTPAQVSSGQKVVDVAKRYIGTPYVYGGMSPSGFDCSGFVKYVYSQMGISLNRVAADQANNGYAVSKDAMVPGDIICFANAGGTGYIGHVGIYVGNNQFIHSPRTGYTVTIESLAPGSNYGNKIACVRRIF